MHLINKPSKTFQILYLIVIFSILSPICPADNLPLSKDIEELYQEWMSGYEDFMQESFKIRMQYEFSGKFLTPEDKDALQKLAEETTVQLNQIIEQQKTLKKQIEDYQGKNWEKRFGETGIWRDIYYGIYQTNLRKYEVNFYTALGYDRERQSRTLQRILQQINELNETYKTKVPTLLKARTLVRLAKTNKIYKEAALKELKRFMIFSDYTPIAADIEKLKLQDSPELEEVNRLKEFIIQNHLQDHYELVIPLVSIQRRFDANGFKDTLCQFGDIKDIVSTFVLNELSCGLKQKETGAIQKSTTVFEAELAAEAAWGNEPKEHKQLLEFFTGTDKFQTPLTTYVAATALSSCSPQKAVKLLMKSAKLQQETKSRTLEIGPSEIARQAAKLAYSSFEEKPENCQITLNAFECYLRIAEPNIDGQLQFLYAGVLRSCGKNKESKSLLEEIALLPGSKWQRNARLELTSLKVKQNKSRTLTQTINLLNQFSSLLEDHDEIEPCLYADEILTLLEQLDEKVDLVIETAQKPDQFLGKYQTLAELLCQCIEEPKKQKADLILTELSILANQNDPEKLSKIEDLIAKTEEKLSAQNIDLLRCQARLLTAQRKFSPAVKIWTQIADVRRNQGISTQNRSWEWFRAKYFQLYCFSKTSKTNKPQIPHTIEVLENSFEKIPEPWAKKLNRLKKQILN